MMTDNYSWRQQARRKALFAVIMLFACGIWLSLPMFIRKADLIEISGRLDTAWLKIATVSSTNERYGVSNTVYSQKATLTFSIKGYDQRYSIAKNIGDRFVDEDYDRMLSGLKSANLVSVWIKKKDSLETDPDVWQISGDGNPLMSLSAAKEKDLPIILLLFGLGGGLLALLLWKK